MGAVGNIMAGSGFEELWSTMNAPSFVSHMVTGHAYSHPLSEHFLVQEALTSILKNSNVLDDTRRDSLRQMDQSLLGGSDMKEAYTSAEAVELTDNIQRIYCDTMDSRRTVKPWMEHPWTL